KIESGQVTLDRTTVAVAPLCRSSLAFVKQQALKKQIQIEVKLVPNLPDLFIDERRIRQVLINLLSNAVKFTPEGGQITLDVHVAKTEDGGTKTEESFPVAKTAESLLHSPTHPHIHISITDTGIGIAPDDMVKLFQPFVQIDSSLNRQYAGTGLGLTLVKRLVELHEGQVRVHSQEGVGSCFTIELPCTITRPSCPLTMEQESQSVTSMSMSQVESPLILLAEDNDANIFTISNYLAAKGYRLAIARNGQEAIALAQQENPSLILMDIQMPEMDGFEAIHRIRGYTDLADVPIIALTALVMEGDRDRCLAAGANDYLSKPVKLKQLVHAIEQFLGT
ncbi:MAG: ATP-binding protein, partial [Leptolyngbyaceae bacterium]|nr:ATP-binding protein [Leptolyngbyaceae bacterium]